MSGVNTSPRRTEGATLFVVVLVVLFLLTALMAITAQFTLAARRSTADQENTLRAQYAAESTIARAQAQMNMLGQILNYSLVNGTQYGFSIPSGTNSDTIAAHIKNLCGIASGASLPLANATAPICGSTAVSSNMLAGITDTAALDTRLSLFTAVDPASGAPYVADAALAAAGGPAAGSSLATKQAFWRRMFGGNTATNLGTSINGLNTQGTVGAVITSVYRLTGDGYQVRFRVPEVNVRAQGTASTRALKVSPQATEYALYIGRPPLAKYALFTNHHFSDANAEKSNSRITFTSNTTFTGPVHTNQQFNFQGNPTFAGPVSSAGCVAGGITTDSSGNASCLATVNGSAGTQQGAYFFGSKFVASNSATLQNPDGSAITNPTYSYNGSTSSPQFNYIQPTTTDPLLGGSPKPIDWGAGFQQLPPNSNDQASMAKAGGLYINSSVTNMSLAVGTSGAINGMQLISYTKSNGTTVNLAINSSGAVLIRNSSNVYVAAAQVASGEWVAAAGATGVVANSFNGVVYVNTTSGTGIADLNGPARTGSSTSTSTSSNTAPSIASFMKMNITSNASIAITSDIRYQDPPCTDAGVCSNQGAQNVLGIYSSTGDVTLGTGSILPPQSVSIQAVLMASQGKVTVNNYDTIANRGNVQLMGGIIENYYGAFGTVGTKTTGYGRNFVYDPRTAKGVLPPGFPTTQNWLSNFASSTGESKIRLGNGAQIQQSNSQYKNNTGNQ